MTQFEWIPGHGPDRATLERLKKHYPRPRHPMGEAWFMGNDRKMYSELLTADIENDPEIDVFSCLYDIATGTRSFGLYQEWNDWFLYFLPRLLGPKRLEMESVGDLTQVLISAFLSVSNEWTQQLYPGFYELYLGFFSDALATLGQWVMAPEFWNGNSVRRDRILQPSKWYEVCGEFSASMFFCWKYLPTEQIDGWIASVFRIQDAHWRAQLLVWLVGIQLLLDGRITQPTEFDRDQPGIAWYFSTYLTRLQTPFIGVDKLTALSAAVRTNLTEALFFEWLDQFANVDDLEAKLCNYPDLFAVVYLNENRG